MKPYYLALQMLGLLPCDMHQAPAPTPHLQFRVCLAVGFDDLARSWDHYQTSDIFKACGRDHIAQLPRAENTFVEPWADATSAREALRCAQAVLNDPNTKTRIINKISQIQAEPHTGHHQLAEHWTLFFDTHYRVSGGEDDPLQRANDDQEKAARFAIEKMMGVAHPATVK